MRAFWGGGGGDMQLLKTPPLNWVDADRQWHADEAARSEIEQELAAQTAYRKTSDPSVVSVLSDFRM